MATMTKTATGAQTPYGAPVSSDPLPGLLGVAETMFHRALAPPPPPRHKAWSKQTATAITQYAELHRRWADSRDRLRATNERLAAVEKNRGQVVTDAVVKGIDPPDDESPALRSEIARLGELQAGLLAAMQRHYLTEPGLLALLHQDAPKVYTAVAVDAARAVEEARSLLQAAAASVEQMRPTKAMLGWSNRPGPMPPSVRRHPVEDTIAAALTQLKELTR